MQKARCQEPPSRRLGTPSNRLLAHGFRFYFTRHLAFFSPFPHGTSALSVTEEYLALEGGPPRFPQDFSCPAVLGIPLGAVDVSLTGLSPSLAGLSRPLRIWSRTPMLRSHNPDGASSIGLGCSPFARRYSGNRGCFLFLRVLRCFSSPG